MQYSPYDTAQSNKKYNQLFRDPTSQDNVLDALDRQAGYDVEDTDRGLYDGVVHHKS